MIKKKRSMFIPQLSRNLRFSSSLLRILTHLRAFSHPCYSTQACVQKCVRKFA